MGPIIEASSLESVKAIATNPPPYPGPPSLAHRYPLVLYIAKVPGSRDIFLTPLKPREKVVTAADVGSSLYYVHINTCDDYGEDESATRISPSNKTTASPGPAPNLKDDSAAPPPLPARRPMSSSPPPYPAGNAISVYAPPSPPPPQRVLRKPLLPVRAMLPTQGQQPPLEVPRLPPRPLPSPPSSENLSSDSLHTDNLRLLRHSDHSIHQNPYTRDYETHPAVLRQRELDARPEPGTLTLIRRDPGTNEQWNVATIHDPAVEEVSSTSTSTLGGGGGGTATASARRRTKQSGAPLFLDITNPGYAQFVPDESGSGEGRENSFAEGQEGRARVFRRRLYKPGSRHGSHGYSSGPPLLATPGDGGGMSHRREQSATSIGSSSHGSSSFDLRRSTLPDPSPPPDRRTRGYTFVSPWGGTCEFRTGAAGRNLLCRHSLPGSASATNGAGGAKVAEVSELRFNLPTMTTRKGDKGAETDGARAAKRGSYFAKHFPRSSFDDGDATGSEKGEPRGGQGGRKTPPAWVVDDLTGRFDLTLGRERAGGGFGGKKAKLGKLIVEPEGLQMLDLLVAANVGLWWRAYERV